MKSEFGRVCLKGMMCLVSYLLTRIVRVSAGDDGEAYEGMGAMVGVGVGLRRWGGVG